MEQGRRRRNKRGDGERLAAEILDAATDLLIETGSADAVSIRAVAQRAGPESWREPSSLPGDLAAYLRADPAPIVPPDRLHTLLTRIEDL